MKKIILLTIILISVSANAQNIIGSWERIHSSNDGKELKSIVIFTESHQSISIIENKTGKLIHSNGGTWSLDGNTMTEVVEFDTDNPERVGSSVVFDIELNNNYLKIVGSDRKFFRNDDGGPGELNGAWLMSSRIRNGVMQKRETNRPRKTMKILSGTRFQWIAYDTSKKTFIATGGGTYTTKNGIYTENIEFFSRDISRVGMKLEFEYSLKDGNWNHKGFSSRGKAISEIWTKR
jgi:hypothetical protein